MKKSIRIITVAMSLLIAFSVSVSPVATRAKGGSAKQEAAKSKKPKYKIKVKKSMVVGEKQKLKVTKLKKGDKVKWSSSKKKVATVSKKGLVKAVKAGTAKITAKIGKKKRSITLTVKPKPEKKEIITPTPTPFAGISPTPWPKRTPYNGPTPTPTPGPTPPVTIDQIPHEIEIKTESVTGDIYLECNFTNNSRYTIMNFRIDLLIDESKVYPAKRNMAAGLGSPVEPGRSIVGKSISV